MRRICVAFGLMTAMSATGVHAQTQASASRAIALPDTMGLEVCEALRRTPGGKEIPVVALSAFSAFEMQGQAYAAGCRHYLEKGTTSPLEVMHKIEGILGRPPAPGAGATPWMLSYPESGEADGLDRAPVA